MPVPSRLWNGPEVEITAETTRDIHGNRKHYCIICFRCDMLDITGQQDKNEGLEIAGLLRTFSP